MNTARDIDLFSEEEPGSYVVEIFSAKLGCWIACTPTISYTNAKEAMEEMLSFDNSASLRIQKVEIM